MRLCTDIFAQSFNKINIITKSIKFRNYYITPLCVQCTHIFCDILYIGTNYSNQCILLKLIQLK